MKLWLSIGMALCLSLAWAQKLTNLKPGSKDHVAIMKAAKVKFQTAAAFPLKTPKGPVRRSGNWAYFRERLFFTNPKHIGDGDGMALLKLSKGKWVIVEWNVGSGGMEDLAQEWTKTYKLPKGLAR